MMCDEKLRTTQRTESLKFQTEFVLNVVLNSARVLKISETILNIAYFFSRYCTLQASTVAHLNFQISVV
jgi:hypothetical protein